MKQRQAFTLIELLIVVAIIAILAAIAVPNFLEAQVRSKVSRVKADLRSAATALGAYYVDFNRYPYDRNYDATAGINNFTDWYFDRLWLLSTPIAYLSSTALTDPFYSGGASATTGPFPTQPTSFRYYNLGYGDGAPGRNWGDVVAQAGTFPVVPVPGYVLKTFGPNKVDGGIEWYSVGPTIVLDGTIGVDRVYDPTNGTVSDGDIARIEGTPHDLR